MLKNYPKYHPIKVLIWVLLLYTLTMMVVNVSAIAITINTDDGNIDSNWISPIFVDTNNSPSITDDLEIKNAWIGSDGNGTSANNIFFRIETYAGPAIPSGYAAAAALDCNQNGSTSDGNPDRRILYNTQYDYVSIRFANNNAFAGSKCSGNPPTNPPCADGERTTPNMNVEWKLSDLASIPSGNDEAFPADCRDAINIAFAIVNTSTSAASDQTGLFGFNVPTVVELSKLSQGGEKNFLNSMNMVYLLVVLLGALLVYILVRKEKIIKMADQMIERK